MKQISFVIPSRNNLKYLKWSYSSLRKNCNPKHWICLADDASNDGTWEWMQEIMKKDKYVKAIRNKGPERCGHTILYDRIVEELVETDIFMIYHADMYAAKEMDKEVLRLLKPQTVVSVTRIEPPLHPEGPEKIIMNFGIEPEEFNEKRFLKYADNRAAYSIENTQGMFAPWAIYKEDFVKIGGHDPLFAPQSREDSDAFNRFLLAGYEPIQTWDTFVYHMTCRGSRFNPQLTQVGQASAEWLAHNRKSERNFTRKWGHMVKHDSNLRPIIPHKYNTSFLVDNCTPELLDALEPWCSRIYSDFSTEKVQEYIENEQPNTMYDLKKRISCSWKLVGLVGDVIVKFDGRQLTQQKFMEVITQFSSILDQIKEVGEYEFDIFSVDVRAIRHYENELIVCDKTKTVR
jgi:glycosyltransferase involved in cell wall biosynthesis